MKGMAGWHTTTNFQQIAATSPSGPWERRDVDLWNSAFSGCQRRPYGQHCFGSTHLSEECSGAPDTAVASTKERVSSLSKFHTTKICREWNFSPLPHCLCPGCKFTHACMACSKDPYSSDKNHKIIHSPRSTHQPQAPIARTLMGQLRQ